VKLFIATVDVLYAKLISDNISEFHADKIDVCTCCALEGLQEALSKKKYDVALIDPTLIDYTDTSSISLPLLLWSQTDTIDTLPEGWERISKYQRISSIVSSILEKFAGVSGSRFDPGLKEAKITAVWSPAGGAGKTSVALAYALSCVHEEKEVFYLNLEDFSSVPCYFTENNSSISNVFEMLENQNGNVKMLIQGVCSCENGITFLCSPDNYEDINILSDSNVHELITACTGLSDELVIDLSSTCDARIKKIFDLADSILLVTAQTTLASAKLAQFITQNNVFENIKEKITLVANKGVRISDPAVDSLISLPYIQSNDAIEVCKKLSESIINADIQTK